MSELEVNPAKEEQRLDSWKEIAAYLGRDVRTAQRWEKQMGLPVYRLTESKSGSVFAFRSEIDGWRMLRAQASPLPEPAMQPLPEEPPPAASTVSAPQRWWYAIALATFLLGGALIGVIHGGSMLPDPSGSMLPDPSGSMLPDPSGSMLPDPSGAVAVLPLQSHTEGAQPAVDSLTDHLITVLGHGHQLRVLSGAAVARFRHGAQPLREMQRELGVAAILEGSVLRDGQRLRFSARLVNPRTESVIWAKSYAYSGTDLLALQNEIATDVSREVAARLSPRKRL